MYPEDLIKVLDQKDYVTQRRTIKFFKVQWSNHIEEATWESEVPPFAPSGLRVAKVRVCATVRYPY
jgi:hypothetical protein